jgi:hypothetical protein
MVPTSQHPNSKLGPQFNGGNKAQVPNKNKNKLPMAVANICLVSSFEWSQWSQCPNSKLRPNSCQNFNGGIKQQQQVANICLLPSSEWSQRLNVPTPNYAQSSLTLNSIMWLSFEWSQRLNSQTLNCRQSSLTFNKCMGLSFEWSQRPNVPTPNWAHMGGKQSTSPQ